MPTERAKQRGSATTGKRQFNVRLPEFTRNQIDDLCQQMDLSKPELFMLAIDRLWFTEFDLTRSPRLGKHNPDGDGDTAAMARLESHLDFT